MDSGASTVWRSHTAPLSRLAYRRAELCLGVETSGGLSGRPGDRAVVWANPKITTRHLRVHRQRRAIKLTPFEQAHQEKQLRALGYLQ